MILPQRIFTVNFSSCFSMRPSSTHKVVAYDCERDHTNRKLLYFNLNVMDGLLWSRWGFIFIWGVPSLFLMKCKMSGLCVSVHILDCKSYTLIFTFLFCRFLRCNLVTLNRVHRVTQQRQFSLCLYCLQMDKYVKMWRFCWRSYGTLMWFCCSVLAMSSVFTSSNDIFSCYTGRACICHSKSPQPKSISPSHDLS